MEAAWEELRQARIAVKRTEELRDATLQVLWQVGLKMQTTGSVTRDDWDRHVQAHMPDQNREVYEQVKVNVPLVRMFPEDDEPSH